MSEFRPRISVNTPAQAGTGHKERGIELQKGRLIASVGLLALAVWISPEALRAQERLSVLPTQQVNELPGGGRSTNASSTTNPPPSLLIQDVGPAPGATVPTSGPDDTTGGGSRKADVEDLLFKDLPAPVVTSATKVEQPITEAPSAITVITAEDIKRMGARRLVDVFRWTPGLNVFTLTGNIASVSARGVYSLHHRYVNEMLVLIDGRSVYVDFIGGVEWDTLPVVLEEIERIEIIMGPSGSLYGPNAFAGTISIFTKRKPEAAILRTTVGSNTFFENNMVQWISGERYQIRLGFGWLENEGFGTNAGRDFRDNISFLKMNGYARYELSDCSDLELRGGWLTGSRGYEQSVLDVPGREDTDVPYGHVLWEHRFSKDSRFRAQYYHNHFNFDRGFTNGSQGLETWTDVVNLEQFWRVNPRHQLIFGGEYRIFGANSGLTSPTFVEENFRSLYVEDDITLREDKLHLILGLRYDDYSVSGDDFSPRTALVWTPSPEHSYRASVSRAIATPMTVVSHLDYLTVNGSIDVGPPFGVIPIMTDVQGNLGLDPESIVAYEIGYRGRWSKQHDVTADFYFYEIQDLVRTVETGPPALNPAIPALVAPLSFGNDVDTLAYGTELRSLYRWNENLTTSIGYAYQDIPGVRASGTYGGITNYQNSLFYTSDWRFACDWMLSTRMAWNDGYDLTDTFSIPDYTRFDLRLARSFWDGAGTVEFLGQNLLDPQHPEGEGVEVNRMLYFSFGLNY